MNHIPTEIERPRPEAAAAIKDVSSLLAWDVALHSDPRLMPPRRLHEPQMTEIWYRGVTRWEHELAPGIYRGTVNAWVQRARDDVWLDTREIPKPLRNNRMVRREYKRLKYEREMMAAFERELAPFLEHRDEQELYFAARHHLIPNRLLDWSTNPLVALYMAVCDGVERGASSIEKAVVRASDKTQGKNYREWDGPVIFVMEPTAHLGTGEIFNQYDDEVEEAIKVVTEYRKPPKRSRVLPIRPHTRIGRIERQSSRFTMHCHLAKPIELGRKQTLRCRAIDVGEHSKPIVAAQLARLNINQFTVYNTIDRLAREIKYKFGIGEKVPEA